MPVIVECHFPSWATVSDNVTSKFSGDRQVFARRITTRVVSWITHCLGIEWPESSSLELSANILGNSRGRGFKGEGSCCTPSP